MALRWVEGFESVGSSDGSAVSGMAIKYVVTSADSDLTLRAGRTGGHACEVSTASTTSGFTTPALATITTITIGFAFKKAAYSNSVHNVLQILDGATIHGTLRINNAGEWIYLRGSEVGVTLGTTTGAFIPPTTWFYVELIVKISDTIGTVDLYINGVSFLSLTSQDTRNSGNASCDRVRFYGSSAAVDDPTYDDIYILDDSGSVNNARLGSQKVLGIFPDGAGSSTDFTASTGANYATVDENPANGDTDYVQSGTSGHKDLWTYGTVNSLASIKGVQVNTTVRETDATPFSLHQVCKSSGTTSDGSSTAIAGQTFRVITPRILETDPNTSSAWTATNLDAAEFGIKLP